MKFDLGVLNGSKLLKNVLYFPYCVSKIYLAEVKFNLE